MAAHTKARRRPLVMVEWVDSKQPSPQWQWLNGFEAPEVSRMTSVGFLVQDTKTQISVALSLGAAASDGDVQINGVMQIPRRSILRMRRLNVARR